LAKPLLKVDNKYTFYVFGIISSSKDYRVCHFLNKELKLNLSPQEEILIENKKRIQNFMMNRFSNDNSEVISNFHLINNKYNGEVLIKSMKNIDFFFIIEGELLKSELTTIEQSLKQIDIIEHYFKAEKKEFEGIEHLIFETADNKKTN
jgi:hypothetical protein